MKTEPQIVLGFDPNLVKIELENEFWQEYWQDKDQEARSIYLGTVFSLTPSGKYYMPFACSNVDLCDICNGRGMISGGKAQDRAHNTISKIRDMINSTIATYPQKSHTITRRKPAPLTIRLLVALYQIGKAFAPSTCENCQGIGSREAYLDTLWWENCNALYDSHGFCVESGEGDPCDVFATQYRDKAD